MTQHTDSQIETILAVTNDIKAMVVAERRESELSVIHDKLEGLDRQHDAIRDDLREILMLLAQNQTAAD